MNYGEMLQKSMDLEQGDVVAIVLRSNPHAPIVEIDERGQPTRQSMQLLPSIGEFICWVPPVLHVDGRDESAPDEYVNACVIDPTGIKTKTIGGDETIWPLDSVYVTKGGAGMKAHFEQRRADEERMAGGGPRIVVPQPKAPRL